MYIFKYLNTSQQCYFIIPGNLCLLMYRESWKKDISKSWKRKRSEVFRFHQKSDGHGVGSYLGLNEIGSPSPMMNFITINYLFNCVFGFIR